MTDRTEALLAAYIVADGELKPQQELAIAVRDATRRLKAADWPDGTVVHDDDDVKVVIWPTPFPVGKNAFAFDTDMQPYFWASRAGHDRQGRWCRVEWGQYRPHDEGIREVTLWINSVAT